RPGSTRRPRRSANGCARESWRSPMTSFDTNEFETPERRALRDLTRRFTQREVVPYLDAWERAGEVPRELHKTAAALGLLGAGFPEEVGGSGGGLLDTVVVTEELIQAGGSFGLVAALFTHGIALPHIVAAWH